MANQDKKKEKEFEARDEEEAVASGRADEQAELAGATDQTGPEGGG